MIGEEVKQINVEKMQPNNVGNGEKKINVGR